MALLGSSGVGKSTIVNRLLGEERIRVGAIREADGKGRHTTTSRKLVELPGGALLIDTPGLRELQLWASESSVDSVFEDIAGLRARADSPTVDTPASLGARSLKPSRPRDSTKAGSRAIDG